MPPPTEYQAAPLVIPPLWANSLMESSQPGVRGFDILQQRILHHLLFIIFLITCFPNYWLLHCTIPGVIASVLPGEVPEGHVVRAGRVLGGVGRLALVVGIVGHQVTAVHVGGELEIIQTEGGGGERGGDNYHEGCVHDHLDHGLGLRLDPVVKVRPLIYHISVKSL